MDEDYPARPEIKQSLTGWGDNCGSESSTLETDVCVWRYAPLVVHATQEEEDSLTVATQNKLHLISYCHNYVTKTLFVFRDFWYTALPSKELFSCIFCVKNNARSNWLHARTHFPWTFLNSMTLPGEWPPWSHITTLSLSTAGHSCSYYIFSTRDTSGSAAMNGWVMSNISVNTLYVVQSTEVKWLLSQIALISPGSDHHLTII